MRHSKLKKNLKIYADFHNADAKGRLRLNCVGTMQDLSKLKVELRENLWLTLYSEELEADGQVQYSTDESLWVAAIDWNAIRYIEQEPPSSQNEPEAKRRSA